jgi:hypothetical protein
MMDKRNGEDQRAVRDLNRARFEGDYPSPGSGIRGASTFRINFFTIV